MDFGDRDARYRVEGRVAVKGWMDFGVGNGRFGAGGGKEELQGKGGWVLGLEMADLGLKR